MRFLLFFCITMGVASCASLAPASHPPQLDHTPGVFIRIEDEWVQTPLFRVAYPAGWRVIKISPASAPIELVFASPDNTLVIRIREGNHPGSASTPSPEQYEYRQVLEQNSITLTITGEAPSNQRADLEYYLEFVRRSILATP